MRDEEILYLQDCFPECYPFDFPDDDHICINGKTYEYFITLDPDVPDDACCRVEIGGKYYYF